MNTLSSLVNPKTEAAIDRFVANPTHSVMLVGDYGSGKVSLTHNLLSRINPKMSVRVFTPEAGKAIGIDAIRELRAFLQIKSASQLPGRAAVVVPADTLTDEAQNALLKTLEEPAKGSMVILLVRNPTILLPTVLSRVRQISVFPVSLELAIKCFKDYDESTVTKNYALSGGASELLNALLAGEEHPAINNLAQAREFLTSNLFTKLRLAEQEKANTVSMVRALQTIVKTMIQNPNIDSQRRKRLKAMFLQLHDAELKLAANVNKKAVLLELALTM